MPLAIEHHQILNTEWGLGRVRPLKGETIVTENSLPSLAEALPITVMYSSSSETTIAHLSWIFPVYLRHLVAIIEEINGFVPSFANEWQRGREGGKVNELDRLQKNLADQLASMEEDWEDAINGEEWAESDEVKEKEAIAGIIQDSRSWGRRARCKIEEFRANEIRHCTRSKQERGFVTTRQKTRHQKRQLTEQTPPDPGRNGTDKAAVFHKNRSTPHNEHRVPPSSQNSQFSRHQSTEPSGSQKFDTEMHAVA